MIDHLKAVWRFRYFWGSLVRLDLKNRYRRSVLGIGWSLLHPIAITVVFCLVFSNIMTGMGGGGWKDYAPFLLAGLAVWEFIKGSALQGCDAFLRGEPYIRQCPLPYTIYPLRTVLGTLIHFTISFGVLVIGLAGLREDLGVFRVLPSIVPAVLMAVVFAWSLALMAAFAQVYFHDTKHLIEVAAQMFFFLTPIMYDRKILDEKQLGWIADANPVTLFLELIRTPLLTGIPPTVEQYTQGGVLTLAAFGMACGTLTWLQKRLIFQL